MGVDFFVGRNVGEDVPGLLKERISFQTFSNGFVFGGAFSFCKRLAFTANVRTNFFFFHLIFHRFFVTLALNHFPLFFTIELCRKKLFSV